VTAEGIDLASELAIAKAKAEENYNKFLYAMADFENYKKRIERQLGEIALSGKKSVLIKFLPVLDNLERALTFDQGSEGLRGGLQATLRGFESAFGTQVATGVEDDIVLEEAQRAYMYGEDLLRPAAVIVAKAAD